jgi:hypothetical protein
MSVITLIPVDSTVVIDDVAAFDVDFTGIDPSIHAVSWYGTQGVVQYIGNPITGEKPPNEVIDSLAPYQSYVSAAQAILYAQDNPVSYWSYVNDLVYQGETYGFGVEVIVTDVGWPQPAQTTPKVPTTPEDFQKLYWYNNNWIVSSFDPTLSLSAAKTYLIQAVQTSAAAAGAAQAAIYSPAQLFAAPSVGDLPTADYFGVTLAQYQTYLDSEVASQTATINAATSNVELYGFNPEVNPAP